MFADFTDLDRSIPIPLYYQLKTILLNKIQSGAYPEGTCIPTEIQMAEDLQISRSTVRQAVAELVKDGWLERKISKGTFVCHPPEARTSYIRSFEPFYQQIRRQGKTPRTELLEMKVIEANQSLAEAMGLNPGDKVISMFRQRFSDDDPMVTIHNHLPWSICGFVMGHDFKTESLYEIMTQDKASRPVRTRTIVCAERADTWDADHLKIKLGAPILSFQTISYNEEGQIVDYATSHYRGDYNNFEIDALPGK